MITAQMLENDCNYLENGSFGMPKVVRDYIWENADVSNKYCGYIYQMQGEIVIRTWAFKRKYDGLHCTEVERKTLGLAIRKNIYLTTMGGYHPVFEPKTYPCSSNWYGYYYSHFDGSDFDKWFQEPEMGLWTTILNIQRLFEIDKYKYCGFSGGCNLFRYLEYYNKEPMVEFFGKIGIEPGSKYINLAKKDKQFLRFLRDNAEEIRHDFLNQTEVIWAYKNKCSFKQARDESTYRRTALRATSRLHNIKNLSVDRVGIYRYLDENNVSIWNYTDYFEAIVELGLDLHDTKNIYPRDFKRMHDLRIEEYESFKAKRDSENKKALYRRFRKKAKTYKQFEIQGADYCIVIPKDIPDLIFEGSKLCHCVGKMGYDKKVADGKSIIAFVRKNSAVDEPFVTLEYLIDTQKVSQCYGKHDSRPADEVISFANDWGKMVKKMMKSAAV